MKKISATTMLIFVCITCNVAAQNQVYMLTEKYDGQNSSPPSFDSVFVTSPTGVTTTHSIPHFFLNIAAHDSQLNIIINGITATGCKIICDNWNTIIPYIPVSGTPYLIRTLYFGIP